MRIFKSNIPKGKEHSGSADRFRFIAENSVDVIWQMDLRLTFIYVSPAIYPMTGYTPEEWVGTKLSKYATYERILENGPPGSQSH